MYKVEEERFANKVIEYFNAGTLKLDDNDRGITLRAYLAHKLGCDPMRITKKYTGASCLGKRVYHAFRQNGKNDEMDRTTAELNVLESEFKAKLMQSSRKRSSYDSYSKVPTSITTPGIDAIFGTNSSTYRQPQASIYSPHMVAIEALTGVTSSELNGIYNSQMLGFDRTIASGTFYPLCDFYHEHSCQRIDKFRFIYDELTTLLYLLLSANMPHKSDSVGNEDNKGYLPPFYY